MITNNHDPNPNPTAKIGYTKPMIEWRRNKVLHRLCMGWSQAEIAKELQLDPSTISLDVQFLKEQAKKELQTHISERLPFEYNRAVTGINTVLKKTSEILEKAEDTKTKMECLKLQMELYRSVMSLATDGGIIEQAFKKVEQLQDSQSGKSQLEDTTLASNDAKVSDEETVEPEEDSQEQEEEG
jgi:LPS O-antigen subunit length determinant protein (WzzB/FepE family)